VTSTGAAPQTEEGKFFKQIRERFLTEVRGVEAIDIPEWNLHKNGKPVPPTTMQKMTAYQMTQRRTWGNWAGAGAGKTAAAGLAAFATDSQLTLVITTNSTRFGWSRQLKEAFKDVRVAFKPELVERGRGMFLVLNYEKFQKCKESFIPQIAALSPDMVVLDEIQLIKQRAAEPASLRRETLLDLIGLLPNAKVLCMSATPVINELAEGISLLEVATGKIQKLSTRKTINNALSVYYGLLKAGLRYRPQYSQKLRTTILPATTKSKVLNAVEKCDSILSLEQTLLPSRLETVKDYIQPGVVLYSEFVDGMVDPTVEFVQSLGLTVAKYTGEETTEDREKLQREFISGAVDVLVGSRAISVGVDGLQDRCNRMIFLSLPWTHAAYEQTIGRIYRQGSAAAEVEIVIPQIVVVTTQGSIEDCII
jgi:hypothetical protein